jgi:hypothetical protein
MEHLVRIDAMPARDDGDRGSSLQRLFHDLAPFLLRTILPFARWLSGYDFRIPRGSHASRITASDPKRKTVVTGRLLWNEVAVPKFGFV